MILVLTTSTGGSPFGSYLLTENLVAAFLVADGLANSIGESSITLTTGTVDDIINASWPFPATAVMLQADTDEGGDVFFDSANSMAPIVRFGYEWYALLNTSFVWIGPHVTRGGVLVYTDTMASSASAIQNYLGRYVIPLDFAAINRDGSEMLNRDGSSATTREA